VNFSNRRISTNFSIPLKMLEELDKACGGKGYRSKYMTKALRIQLKKDGFLTNERNVIS